MELRKTKFLQSVKMSANEYNSNTESNLDMAYNYFMSVNNNLPTMANNNLIDLSNHAARAHDLTVSERTQSDNNRVIRTKGAKKIIIDNKGTSYQSRPSKTPTEGVNYGVETRSVQMPFYDMPPMEIPRAECIYDMEALNRLASFEDISSVETQNDDNNSQNDEVDQNYSALDESTMAKIQECSEINKAVINTLMNKLSIGMLPPLVGVPNNAAKGKCLCDSKGFRALLSCFMDIIAIAQLLMKKPTSDKSSQTVVDFKEPPVVTNKATQTVDESVPRDKINTKVHPKKDPNKVQQKKELAKEKTARQYYNAQTSKQNTNVQHNQQEQFYNNQQYYPQVPTDQSYVMQTEWNRNNMQLPMMQYGMPYTSNAMQGAESGNNGMEAMLAMNQYGMAQTQNTNTMMQRDYRMTGMQMPQPEIPQQVPSGVQAQTADVTRNRMETMMQSRSYYHANTTLTATVPPTFYQHRMSTNVPTQEIPREMQRNPPVTQTVTQATTPSSGRGRRSHAYFETASSPYPLYNQWQMPNHENQFRKN